MLSRWIPALTLLVAVAPPLLAGPIENLRPGEWYQAPNTHMETVFPNPYPEGNSGPPAVMSAWCGAAYDTKRDRLVVWGGGHHDYSGNELYVFDVNQLRWQRLTNPTMDVSGTNPAYYNDGKPRARHTYAYLEYVGGAFDRFCSFGGGSTYPGDNTPSTDCFNFDTNQWEYKGQDPSYGLGAPAAADPVTGKVWQHGTVPSASKLSVYDPGTNTFTIRGDYFNQLQYADGHVAVVDPVRRKFIVMGKGQAFSWNIDGTGLLTPTNVRTLMTGSTGIVDQNGFGAAYDPVSDKVVAWDGGADVYVLDTSTWVWTRRTPATTNTVTPPPPAAAGTYGRFRYIPSKNAFIVVNATNQDVYFYKLSAGGGAPPDSIPPSRSTDLRTR